MGRRDGYIGETSYTSEQKQKVLLDMLLHFKGIHDKQNRALVDTGESKFTSPFEHVEVADIKAYAFKEVSGKDGWEDF